MSLPPLPFILVFFPPPFISHRLTVCQHLKTAMQKAVRVNENQLIYLATKARKDPSLSGYLQKKSTDSAGKWQTRYFLLYQNLLFYYDSETSTRPSGIALLEGSYCDRIVLPSTVSSSSSSSSAKNRDNDKQVGIFTCRV